jgi:succinoglycan biosynthesis transport protein ExoP
MEGSPDQGQGPAAVMVSERLAYYLKVLRRRWRVVALVPGVAVVISLAVGLQSQKKYDATAKVVVNPRNQVTALLNPGAAAPSADPERDLNTEVSRIKTVPLAEAVRRQLRLRGDATALLERVSTSLEGTTNIVDIKVRDADPARAAALANAFASRYVAVRESDVRSAFQQAATRAREQLQSLSPAQRQLDQGRQLRSRLQELEVGGALQAGNAQVIQPATAPTTPAGPRVLFDSILAGFLGLVLGMVAAGVLELLDRHVKDEDDVRLITSLPSLATIPPPRRAMRNRHLELGREQTESYRSLAANLRFFKLGREVKTLIITSPSPRDGKTSVTLFLAGALAELGQRVIAVECDLRRPRFAEYLDLPQSAGLSASLAGMVSWSEEVDEIDVSDWRAGPPRARGETTRFSVLPGGAPPPNPHALLSSSEMQELLVELHRSADVVLLDAPPLGTVADAVPLLPWVDGVALVVRLQHTTRDDLRKACNLLAELDAPVVGTVLTGGARPPVDSYYGAESSAPAAGFQDESQNGRAGSQRSESRRSPQA